MSYNARSGHGYGQQSRHNSGALHSGQKKAKQPTFKVPPNQALNQIDHEMSSISAVFTPHILVKIPASWSQPSLTATLPNMEPRKQAFQLAQVLATRKTLELQLVEPNQNVLKFKVSKIEDPDSEVLQPLDNPVLPNQSYSSFEYISNLRSELSHFGYSMTAEKG